MDKKSKRTTIYLAPEVHRALRLKAAETDRSISQLVNETLTESLAEDAEDLQAFEDRSGEPSTPFEQAVKDLKRRGLL